MRREPPGVELNKPGDSYTRLGNRMAYWVYIALLAFTQNVAFSITSRSRNRDSMMYHMVAAIGSNGIWFLTFRELITADMSFTLFVPYTIGTVCGSLFGVKVAMVIERVIGATADGHIRK